MAKNKIDFIKKSAKATCGISERVINVPRVKVPLTIKQLKRQGYFVIGTSHARTPNKKIWFIRRGSL